MAHVIFATPFDPRCKWFGEPVEWIDVSYTSTVNTAAINDIDTNGDTWISIINNRTYHYADKANTDGAAWTEVNLPSDNSFGGFTDIDHFPDTGQFVACGSNSNVWFIDADGTNPTYIDRFVHFTPLGSGHFYALAVLGNTGAIIVKGGGGDQKVYWSLDRGASWSAQSLGFNVSFGDIAWTPSLGGATYGRCLITIQDDVYYTDDGGATWNSYVYPGSTTNINSVTWDDSTNQFLIYDVLKRIYTSPDGITFTLLTTVPAFPSGGTQKIITDGLGNYAAVASGSEIWTSTDLINWTLRSDSGGGSLVDGRAAGNCEWLLGGGDSGSTPRLLRSSLSPVNYIVDSIHFDGINDYVASSGGLTTNDTQVISGSFFLIHRDKTSIETIFANATTLNNRIVIYVLNGSLIVSLTDSTGNVKALSGVIPTNIWNHITFCFDLSTGDGFLYCDDTQIDSGIPLGVSMDLTTSTAWRFGSATTSTDWANICLSNFYLNTDAYIDFSSSINRRKFSNSNFIPFELGASGATPTGTSPFMYFHGGKSNFHLNAGTGGDLLPVVGAPIYGCAFDIENPYFDATHFSNTANDIMTTAGAWAGLTTFKTGTICITFLIEAGISTNGLRIFAGDRAFISKDNAQKFDVNIFSSDSSQQLRMTTNASIGNTSTNSGWITALISFNTATGSRQVWFGNESQLLSTSFTSPTGAVLTFTNSNASLGSANFEGCVHRVWMDLGTAANINFNQEVNRRKFINKDGSLVDLGDNGELVTGSSPMVYYKGDAIEMQTNKGTGGQNLVPANTQTNCDAAIPGDPPVGSP